MLPINNGTKNKISTITKEVGLFANEEIPKHDNESTNNPWWPDFIGSQTTTSSTSVLTFNCALDRASSVVNTRNMKQPTTETGLPMPNPLNEPTIRSTTSSLPLSPVTSNYLDPTTNTLSSTVLITSLNEETHSNARSTNNLQQAITPYKDSNERPTITVDTDLDYELVARGTVLPIKDAVDEIADFSITSYISSELSSEKLDSILTDNETLPSSSPHSTDLNLDDQLTATKTTLPIKGSFDDLAEFTTTSAIPAKVSSVNLDLIPIVIGTLSPSGLPLSTPRNSADQLNETKTTLPIHDDVDKVNESISTSLLPPTQGSDSSGSNSTLTKTLPIPTLTSSTPLSTVTSSSSSTLYPFVKERSESTTISVISGWSEYEYPKYYNKAQAFTVYGESCYDLCEKRGYSYTWCHKFKESSTGYWSTADVCTNDHKVTPYQVACIDACAKRGYDYFWCHTGTTTWGYCTPSSLLEYINDRRNNNNNEE